MSEYRLEMSGVVKTFPGVKALDHAQLKLRPGTVHALMGENGAGKSTLMKCMFGIYHMDEGEVIYEGQKVQIKGPLDALHRGIAMVHQELQPIPERSIGENIYVGRYPMKHGILVDHEKMYEDAAKVLKEVHLNYDPRAKLGTLSVSQMQLVEIAKAVSADCKVLILDEPTSSLTAAEVEALFTIVNELREKGVSIVYISHKMDEILRISDEVTIMRDGQYIGTWDAKGLTTDFIITKMVGRELSNLFPQRENTPGEVVFEVEDFTSINPKSFRHASFNVRKGEILGVAGLVGAQRTELMEGLFGLRSHTAGKITYQGKELKITQPRDAINSGIAMLTEDRRATGILGVLSIADNVSIASLNQYLIGGIMLDDGKIEQLVQDNVAKLSIKTPSSKTQIQSLSGGNQQKVLISRWLAN
ncbi:MAG: sugar ABC transporter ATP-binding protein, partial [Lawsonibacter sp.]|nr:sugar ABC transporter ATP-binding protein [Lawsonibacter sp.]